jgi:hypothetical protein
MRLVAMTRRIAMAALLALAAAAADAGPLDTARDAVDPDCTPAKAAKGAAMRATVGVGNRCDVAETARDVTGVDDRVDGRKKNGDGPLAKRKQD